jgi:chloride channel protein, CIC family
MQESTLLPLIAGCSTAYLVSFIMMRTTIMTEKIKRRGIQLPENYRPDVLELKTVADIYQSTEKVLTTSVDQTVNSLRERIRNVDGNHNEQNLILARNDHFAIGLIDKSKLFSVHDTTIAVSSIVSKKMFTVYPDNSLEVALELMLKSKQSMLPVVERDTKHLVGVITQWDILRVFEKRFIEDNHVQQHISIRRRALRLIGRQGQSR